MKPAQLALKLLVLFISLLPSQLLATSQDLEAIAETQTEHMIERVIAENSETWGSSSPEEWLETTGQSEAAVQSSLIRYNSFQALEGSYLSSLARTELYAFDIYSGFGYQHINSFFSHRTHLSKPLQKFVGNFWIKKIFV